MLLPTTLSVVDLHQRVRGYCRALRGMACLTLAMGLPAVAVGAGSVADAVNERIPVSAAELETHWGVDCLATWATLSGQVEKSEAGEECLVSPQLRRPLELCVFIYQRPGDAVSLACPDYRGALAMLDSTLARDLCRALRNFLSARGRCHIPEPIPR